MKDECLLGKYRTELMGAAAIGVILCHAVVVEVELPQIINRLLVFGNLGVDIFLFVSGFGMFFSLTKAREQKDWIFWYKKRMVRLLIPYVLITFPYWVIYCFVRSFDFVDFLYYFSTLSFWYEHVGVWYVAMIIPLYMVLPLLFGLWSKNPVFETCILTAFTMLFSIVNFNTCSILNATVISNIQFCLKRLPAFWIGMLFGYCTMKCKRWGGNRYLRHSLISIIFYLALSKFRYTAYFCWYFLAAIAISLFFCCAMEIAEKDVRFKSILTWVGTRSLESYLSNYVCVFMFAKVSYKIFGLDFNYGNYLYYLLVIFVGLLFTFISSSLSAWICCRLYLK